MKEVDHILAEHRRYMNSLKGGGPMNYDPIYPPEDQHTILEELLGNDNEDGLFYDKPVKHDDHTIHFHHTNDGPVLRILAPMIRGEAYNLHRLAYDLITTMLSETTNNDACMVAIRETTAHFEHHQHLAYLHLEDDLRWILVEAWIEDFLT